MQLIKGNIWDYHRYGPTDKPFSEACAVVVTTNDVIKKDGRAVMGAGIALQAAQRFPDLPLLLADGLKKYGNQLLYYPNWNLFTFPTKYDWKMPSDLALIERSAIQLASFLLQEDYAYLRVIMTKPGCGHGKLSWAQVEPILNRHLFYLGERVRVIEP
jgi:hypothetical protein